MSEKIIPLDWSPDFLAQLAGGLAVHGYGHSATDDGQARRFTFNPADFEAVDAAVEAYPAAWLAHRKAELTAEAAARRWTAEQAMTFTGVLVATDTAARGNVVSAVVAMQLPGAAPTVRWKFGPTDRRDMTLMDMAGLGRAMHAHVQACFDREEVLCAAIAEAEDVGTLDAIDVAAGWP